MSAFGAAAARLAGAAMTLLAWRPDDFWNATPAEFATALGFEGTAGGPPERGEIEALMVRFPDIEDEGHGRGN